MSQLGHSRLRWSRPRVVHVSFTSESDSQPGKIRPPSLRAIMGPTALQQDLLRRTTLLRCPQRCAAERGRIILISVNSPGCVSTRFSQNLLDNDVVLRESPRPVPSPADFVVKKGLNIFSFTSGEIPVPLSRIPISTRSPRLLLPLQRSAGNLAPIVAFDAWPHRRR